MTQAPSPLNLHISRGGIYRKKIDAPKVRLTKAEMEIRSLQLAEATKLANDGDDTMLRTMTDIRFAVECVVDAGGIMNNKSPRAQYGRRRKFSNPLFLSPAGLIESYPENDEDLFTSEEVAVAAIRKLGVGGEWNVRETLLTMETSSKRYLRWVAEVKGKEFSEARRTLDELAEIYRQGGRAALRALYTREHVAKIVTRLRAAGVQMQGDDDWTSGKPALPIDFQARQYILVNAEPKGP